MAPNVAEKPAFRTAVKCRRGVLPANGFYEWKTEAGRKHPYQFRMADRSPFGLAGLWESWTDSGGAVIETGTIINTAANPHGDSLVLIDDGSC